jgi:hypothetical protein
MAQTDVYNLAFQVANTLQKGANLSYITDAIVAASADRADLIARINAVAAHNDQANLKQLIANAIMKDPGITDAAIPALTTVAGLIALTGVTTTTGTEILD